MDVRVLATRTLLVVQALVAVTAVAGGIALILGATVPSLASVLVPPNEYLVGSPFASYLVPGILLAALLGGIHVIAFVTTLRRTPGYRFIAAATGFAMLIWVFVQMMFIPFSPLQALYFALGLAEVGLVMVILGLFSPGVKSV
jgi:uncharacterized membrane protein